jgi:hypothetical protein
MTSRQASTQVTWKFGDRPEDADAWLAHPDQLHVYVDFRSPKTPPGQWHRIMTVTQAWVHKQIGQSALGAIWPALLIVPSGERDDVEASITEQLQTSWPLLIEYATLLPPNHQPAEW